MKTRKLVASAAVLAVGFGAIAPSVLAANPDPAPSKGVIRFKSPGDIENDLTIPEVVPEVVIVPPTEGGFSTKDGMAILAPFLDFGEHEITQKTESFKALPMVYTEKANPAKRHYLPPMTVVKDLRGDKDGSWNVKVKASAFTAGAHTLVADLSFSNGLLFNNTLITAPSLIPDPAVQEVTNDKVNFKFVAPLTLGTADQVLMASKNGKGAGQTSFVPDAVKYDGAAMSTAIKNGTDFYTATEEISGVQLDIPASSLRTTETYTSNLTWTLADTPDF